MKQPLNLDGNITLIIEAKKFSCMLNLVDEFSTQPSCGATLVPAVYIDARATLTKTCMSAKCFSRAFEEDSMAKTWKSDATRLDELDQIIYSTFCSAKNSLMQL
ncbi:hypothetical protein MRB53_030422 [Persea americana]|uniref:Uncharacterized protein n=1 Tax=Persea americana TaxID=3435 RepID=A0ACC2KL99_PERAE|nr:hypothetical protein MRB53_030422 [Persea americana]